jgi:hypothetical protein
MLGTPASEDNSTLYLNNILKSGSKKTRITVANISSLIIFGKNFALYSVSQIKRMNSLLGREAKLFNLKTGGINSYLGLLRVKSKLSLLSYYGDLRLSRW